MIHHLSKQQSYGILEVGKMEEIEAIAKAIRPITYKKTFRSLEVIFVYTSFFIATRAAS